MDRNTILGLNVNELKIKLQELNLSATGRKATLQDRLLEHFGLLIDQENEDEEEFQDADNINTQTVRTFTLRDICESLDYFDGHNQPEIEKWVEEFEDNALAVGWNDVQKFLYAKQLIKGAAKIFIRSQCNVNNWQKLRKALIDEFGKEISAIEVHKMLRNRRKKLNETCLEYLYTLIEIGSSITLDEQSTIEYFIDGIIDSKLNKSILYGARDMADLKLKIQPKHIFKSQVVEIHKLLNDE